MASVHFWTFTHDDIYEPMPPEELAMPCIRMSNCRYIYGTLMESGGVNTFSSSYPPEEGAYESRADALRALAVKVKEQADIYTARAALIEKEIAKEEQT